MEMKKRLVACVAALCLLIALFVPLLVRPDWRFAIERAVRYTPAPELQVIRLGEDAEEWTLSELANDARTTVTDTLLLVNRAHPLPDGYLPPIEIYYGAEMHPSMVSAYVALRDEVEARTGERIYVSDDYRTREEQAAILAEKGEDVAALVGCSEHEAGLALDVYVKGYGGSAFLKSAGGREVNRICGEYGFVIRYERGKEAITGISYEPWHLRYVGAPHARIMSESNLSMEEYFDLLIPEHWYASGEYRILVTSWEKVYLPRGWETCEISSDNRGHTVITLKMS